MKKITLLKSFLLLCALIVGNCSVWATEAPVYSLTFTKLTSGTDISSYTNPHSITVSSKAWSVYGNQSLGAYIRVGGKNTTATNRTLTSNAALVNKKIYKVIINHSGTGNGKNSEITVNSIKVEGSTNSSFPDASTITKTISSPSVSSSGTLTFEPDNAWAANSYFRITVNYQITGSNNCYITITSVDFYEQVAPEITAADVNIDADVLGGNISYSISHPDGSTLTATKKSGDWLTVGAVDTENSKVAFTATENTGEEREAVVTLTYGSVTKDVTITQAAAATKYAVTFSAPSNGTLVVKRGDDAISSGDEVPDGTTLTIVVTPADGYNFDKWEYSINGGSTWNDGVGTTYGVTSAVQFRASFVAKVYHTITYSVNGVETETDVEEGEAISFAAPASGIPTGYTFKGWRTSTLDLTDTDPNDYITSGTSTADITYYAVMAVGSVTPTTATLTANSSWSSYAEKSFTDDEGNTWNGYCTGQNTSGTYNYGLNKNANNYNIGSPSFSGNVTAISMKVANGSSTDARTVYICSSNSTAQPTSGDIASLSVPKSSTFDTERSIDLSSSPTFSQFYVYVSAALSFSEIKVTYNKTAYSNYCTSIPSTTVTTNAGKWTSFTPSWNATLSDGAKAYIITAVSDDVISATAVDVMKKDEGYFIKGEAAKTPYTATASAEDADDVTGNLIVGCTSNTDISASEPDSNNKYILGTNSETSESGLYLVDSAITIPASKAYLNTQSTAGARILSLDFEDGETTGITTVKEMKPLLDGDFYNLNGQKIAQPTKGLYIVNGRKVVIK